MGLDIRLPVGLLFVVVGILLMAYGMLGDSTQYAKSLGINVNLVWGPVLLVFGAAMTLLGRRAMQR